MTLRLKNKPLLSVIGAAVFVLIMSGSGTGPVSDNAAAPESDYSLPVTPAEVDRLFTRCAGGSGHPYLFFTEDEIGERKKLAETDPEARKLQDIMVAKADMILARPVLGYRLDPAGLRVTPCHTVGNEIVPSLLMAYYITGDEKYALRCIEQIGNMLGWPDWGADRHFLDTGIALKGCAMVYDGLYDLLSADQRRALFEGARRLGLAPGLSQMQGNIEGRKWYLVSDNWNGICHAGLIECALAMYEEDPTLCAGIISMAVNRINIYFEDFNPDGAGVEGMGYWSYGMGNAILAVEAMQRNLGTTFGLGDIPGFRKTGWFPYRISGPVGMASFGDDALYYTPQDRMLSYYWFARHFDDADLARTHYEARQLKFAEKKEGWEREKWIEYLYYDPDLVARGSLSNNPLSGYLRGLEYLFLRENETDEALYIGIHGGDNKANHAHLDAGTFFIEAAGENFAAGNLGKPSGYAKDYFARAEPGYTDTVTDRMIRRGMFSHYRTRAEGKNVLVINPDARPEQDPEAEAVVVRTGPDCHIIDLGECYRRDVTDYRRGVSIDRARKAVTIQDEFTLREDNSTVYWIMHTMAATDASGLSADKKSAVLTRNGKQMVFRILHPAEAEFAIVPASTEKILFLDETRPIFEEAMSPYNENNGKFGKLQIRLGGLGGAQAICVECAEPQSVPGSMVPMAEWD